MEKYKRRNCQHSTNILEVKKKKKKKNCKQKKKREYATYYGEPCSEWNYSLFCLFQNAILHFCACSKYQPNSIHNGLPNLSHYLHWTLGQYSLPNLLSEMITQKVGDSCFPVHSCNQCRECLPYTPINLFDPWLTACSWLQVCL